MGSSPRSGVKILFCPSATMTLQIAIVILATALIASAAHISQDELEERLNKFHGFYASQVEDISEAGTKTHNAVSSVTAELQPLLEMLVKEFGSMHDEIANVKSTNQQLQSDLKQKEAEGQTCREENDKIDEMQKENSKLEGENKK